MKRMNSQGSAEGAEGAGSRPNAWYFSISRLVNSREGRDANPPPTQPRRRCRSWSERNQAFGPRAAASRGSAPPGDTPAENGSLYRCGDGSPRTAAKEPGGSAQELNGPRLPSGRGRKRILDR